ncbi:MAG: hypothetical protein GWN00_01130 [Aliifodinibius sp.]|nr:hypothetical protein [Fodinibius sp.]NIY23464.1 hypothetical protein [Fodinibius sp.]
MSLKVDGKIYYIRGGSCVYPKEPNGLVDVDVFVGLDVNMVDTSMQLPWEHGTAFKYPIKNYGVPGSKKNFDHLLKFLSDSILSGMDVFVGCIGGHGRTGLVLAALVNHMTGEVDAIRYVRENYCIKAVDNQKQEHWLHRHYGIKLPEAKKPKYQGSILDRQW